MDTSAYTFAEGMASQLTLVDPSAYGAPYTFASFDRDDMRNTRVFAADERLLYTIETDTQTYAHTSVFRGVSREDVVAEVKRKDLRADKIKFGAEKSGELKAWLHGSSGKWTDFPVSFSWRGSEFTWKTNGARQIALYRENESAHPIAWFQSSRKEIIDGAQRTLRALLALEEEALDILDAVVVSLFIVESNLRKREIEYRNAAAMAMLRR
ncbi:hypothetical protein M0805_003643 [Coniferiporia weirii]|nr:hypothetical protein M0805_003643 [Coniferiporia weirii]